MTSDVDLSPTASAPRRTTTCRLPLRASMSCAPARIGHSRTLSLRTGRTRGWNGAGGTTPGRVSSGSHRSRRHASGCPTLAGVGHRLTTLAGAASRAHGRHSARETVPAVHPPRSLVDGTGGLPAANRSPEQVVRYHGGGSQQQQQSRSPQPRPSAPDGLRYGIEGPPDLGAEMFVRLDSRSASRVLLAQHVRRCVDGAFRRLV